jgi:hypothetical protein
MSSEAQLYGRYADPTSKMNGFVTTAGPVAPGTATRAPRMAPKARAQGHDAVARGPMSVSPARQLRRRRPPVLPGTRIVDQIGAALADDPGPGGWSGGFANQAHWDPDRPREWRCWAQSGPTWSAHCGAEVAASDQLGLCQRHRASLIEVGDGTLPAYTPEHALSAG